MTTTVEEELDAHQATLPRQAAISSAVTQALRNADEDDWTWLVNRVGLGGHGQFWQAIFRDLRRDLDSSLTADRPTGQTESALEANTTSPPGDPNS